MTAFAFGEFELDEELYELRQGGARVAIRPQALDVLFHLVRHRDRVVTKEELLDKVWGGVVVSETAIPQAIVAVRRALGDDGEAPRFIQTVRARGYRFLAAPEPNPKEPAPITALPFVGRKHLLKRAREVVTDAVSGQGGALSISGGVGSGKTRALLEIATIARDAGATVITARCHDEEGVPALWPWISVLRSLEAPLLAPDAQFSAFDAVVRELVARSKKEPLVVMIDDLQWADDGSLLLVKLVAQAFRSARGLLVAAYRDVAMTGVMARTVGAIARQDPARCLPLEPLDAPSLTVLGNAALGRELDRPTLERLQAKTGGCPLFVTQMLHALRTSDGDRSTSAMLALDAMREAIGHHLGELSDDCRVTLGACSAFADAFTIAALATVLERAPNDVFTALDEAIAHKILTRTGASSYRFVHALVRDVLYKKLGTRERFQFHERAATALRTAGDEVGAHHHEGKARTLIG